MNMNTCDLQIWVDYIVIEYTGTDISTRTKAVRIMQVHFCFIWVKQGEEQGETFSKLLELGLDPRH